MVGYGGEEGKTGRRIWVDAFLTISKRRPLGGGRLFVFMAESKEGKRVEWDNG